MNAAWKKEETFYFVIFTWVAPWLLAPVGVAFWGGISKPRGLVGKMAAAAPPPPPVVMTVCGCGGGAWGGGCGGSAILITLAAVEEMLAAEALLLDDDDDAFDAGSESWLARFILSMNNCLLQTGGREGEGVRQGDNGITKSVLELSFFFFFFS